MDLKDALHSGEFYKIYRQWQEYMILESLGKAPFKTPVDVDPAGAAAMGYGPEHYKIKENK